VNLTEIPAQLPEKEKGCIMAKRTAWVGAVLFALLLMMGGSALAGNSSYTISCQGLDVGLKGSGLGFGSDSAVWSVTVTTGNKLTSGTSTTMYTGHPGGTGSPALTCYYTLDSSSTTNLINGAAEQTLLWDETGSVTGCTTSFTDHVYFYTNGTSAAMIDDNLEADDVAGSGTCNITGTFVPPAAVPLG
jgi:hypothetical protein